MSTLAAPLAILGAAELERFAAALAALPQRWRHRVRVAVDVRSYELVWSDRHVNAWVIHWAGDSDTGFHDHDVSASGIVVLEGTVVEERLALAGPPIARRYRAGQSFHLPPSAIHRVRHGGAGPALTIHAYSPPLRIQGVYRTSVEGALEREAVPSSQELRAEGAILHV